MSYQDSIKNTVNNYYTSVDRLLLLVHLKINRKT